MILIIAEKELAASAIAEAIGADKKEHGYFSGSGYLVSWCVGHLVELAKPGAYGSDLDKWDLSILPIIPQKYITTISPEKRSRYDVLKELMDRPDVTELVEATDPSQEGELNFRLLYQQANCQKPFKRLWISSLETERIREDLAAMRPGSAYDTLYQAALCRQRADWLFGINFTRLYSKMYNKTLTCGRLQPVIIDHIVRRHREIESFQPRSYFLLTADCGQVKVHCQADSQDRAEEITAKCAGQTAEVTEAACAEREDYPAPLYDLTTLQREANRLLGYSAKQTLDYLQRLYESKLTTYPRTNSKYITHGQAGPVRALVESMKVSSVFGTGDFSLYQMGSVDVSRVVNDKEALDHHALLPTVRVAEVALNDLPTGERNILLMICYRLMAAVYQPRLLRIVKLKAEIHGEIFEASGNTELAPGYQIVTAQMQEALGIQDAAPGTLEAVSSMEEQPLPPLEEGAVLQVRSITTEQRETNPPKAYTEDTLLSVMKDCGIGTPAARAGLIENIIKCGYIYRDGRKLLPTSMACSFMDVISPALKSPELAAVWERQLAEIQRGEKGPADFMAEVAAFCRAQIEAAKAAPDTRNPFRPTPEPVGVCPFCGKNVVEMSKSYSCEDMRSCKLVIWKKIAGKRISVKQVKQLLTDGRSELITGLTSNAGKPFNAYLVLKEDHTVGFSFPERKKGGKRQWNKKGQRKKTM